MSVGHCAVKLDAEIAVFDVRRQRERLAIPSRPKDRQRAGMRIQLRIKRSLNRPIVRQAKFWPFGIIEAGLFCAFGLALEEAPAVVKADATLIGNLHAARSTCARRREQKITDN